VWEAIKYVSGGFTLCAFIVAAIARAYQQKNKAELDELKTAPEKDIANIITTKIGAFAVDTSSSPWCKDLNFGGAGAAA
jgi:hypothetical protein